MKIWLPTIRAGSGSDVYVRRLGAALQRRGVEVEVTWLPHWLEVTPMLSTVKPSADVSLVHANSWNAFAFARSNLPLISTVHLPIQLADAQRYKSTAQRLYHSVLIDHYERRSLRSARKVIAVSTAVARSVRDAYPAISPVVIHNWIDTSFFTPETRRARAVGPFRLLFAGNRTGRKGWDLLADLMGRLGAAFELRIAAGLRGGMPLADLPPHSRSLGLLKGEAAMRDAYRQCDAVIVPSRLEGFGYVAAEAMACGKPVVAFNNTAMPELVNDGRTGLLVPTDDVEALAAACRRLADDPDLMAAIGASARSAAVEKFSEEVALGRYLDLYHSVLAGAGTRVP